MGTIGIDIEEELLLGVDFGTTNSVITFFNKNSETVEVIPIDGNNIFPTVIGFEKDEDDTLATIYGIEAKEGAIIYPESTVLSIKSLLGVENKIVVKVDGEEHIFSPEEITGQILEFIRNSANEYIQEELNMEGEFKGVVITVPANSTDKQKKKTKQAAVLAGFEEEYVYLRPEPAAAAISYAMNSTKDSKILVYDFGGGTFDACVLDVKIKNEQPELSISSTFGDNNLGGNDVDKIILDMIYEEFKKLTDNKIDLFDENDQDDLSIRDKKIAIIRLMQVANLTKEKLSKTKSAKVVLSPLIQKPIIVNINMEISREDFLNHRRINKLGDRIEKFEKYKGKNLIDMINLTMDSVFACLDGARIVPSDIDEVFLVGGSSSLPIVSEFIEEKLGKIPYKSKLNPALSIAEGAAYYCSIIEDEENNTMKVQEKTLHSLGLEIAGRRYMEIIKAGTDIPEDGLVVEAEGSLLTSFDNITSMVIVVYEKTGYSESNVEYITNKGMKRLAGTSLKGIPQNLKGKECVKIVFKISKNNMLSVEAVSISDKGIKTQLNVDDLY